MSTFDRGSFFIMPPTDPIPFEAKRIVLDRYNPYAKSKIKAIIEAEDILTAVMATGFSENTIKDVHERYLKEVESEEERLRCLQKNEHLQKEIEMLRADINSEKVDKSYLHQELINSQNSVHSLTNSRQFLLSENAKLKENWWESRNHRRIFS